MKPVPRDLEALEQLLLSLDEATDEADTYRVFIDSFVAAMGFCYGSVWRVDPDGHLELRHESGPTAAQRAEAPSSTRIGEVLERQAAMAREFSGQ